MFSVETNFFCDYYVIQSSLIWESCVYRIIKVNESPRNRDWNK